MSRDKPLMWPHWRLVYSCLVINLSCDHTDSLPNIADTRMYTKKKLQHNMTIRKLKPSQVNRLRGGCVCGVLVGKGGGGVFNVN